MLKNQFVKYNDACIKAFVDLQDNTPLFANLKKLSRLVLENFEPMIPQGFHELWKQGLDSEDYYLKSVWFRRRRLCNGFYSGL